MDGLVSGSPIPECVALSTCNRTEYYFAASHPDEAGETVIAAMAGSANLSPETAREYLYTHDDFNAVVHLYRVTSGLDSLVIGEPQIQGQVGGAYESVRDRASVGPVLHRLFQSALATGGRVRAETGVSRGSASIPSAALNLARKVFGSLEGRQAIVLGTGEMGELTARVLADEGVVNVMVASRDSARAAELAARVGGVPLSHSGVLERLRSADVVVASTSTGELLLTAEQLDAARPENRPLVILDIGLPRNVAPDAAGISGVFLYNIDDLQRVVETAEDARVGEIAAADEIVHVHAARFWRWHCGRRAAVVIRLLREKAERVRDAALTAVFAEDPSLDDDERERLQVASRAALNKILHVPTEALHAIALTRDGERGLETLRRAVEAADAPGSTGREGAAGQTGTGERRRPSRPQERERA